VAKKLAKKIATKDAQCMLRLPPGLRDKVAARAAENGRSMNTEIVEAIERHLQGADRITRLWEFFERHRESLESVPLLRTAVENLEIFAERSGEFRGGLRALRGHQEADQPSVVGEPAERLKAAIDAMRTHSRDFEERIQATKCERQKDPPEVSDRRAPRRLGDLGGRLLRHFRKRGGNGAEGDCMLEAIRQWPGCETVAGIQLIRDNSGWLTAVRPVFGQRVNSQLAYDVPNDS